MGFSIANVDLQENDKEGQSRSSTTTTTRQTRRTIATTTAPSVTANVRRIITNNSNSQDFAVATNNLSLHEARNTVRETEDQNIENNNNDVVIGQVASALRFLGDLLELSATIHRQRQVDRRADQ